MVEGSCLNWLNVTPVFDFGFALSGSEFWLCDLPAQCDGCGNPTSVDHHALNCRKGSLILLEGTMK